jgi:hypothetical protein
MRNNATRIIVAVGTLATIAACGGSTEPDSVTSGRYELTLVNGTTVPMRYLVYGFGGQSYRHIFTGSIKFIGGSRLVDVRHVSDQPQGTQPFEFDYVDTASYEVEGDMIIIDRPGIQGRIAPYSDTAFVDGEVLIMPVRTVEGIEPLVRTLTYLRPE